MCNHYRTRDRQLVTKFARDFVESVESTWELRSEAWPQYNMPVVYENDGRHTLTSMRWGVWPWYDNGPKPKTGYVANARDDKLLNSSVWKESAAKRRCLVPADAWLEWINHEATRRDVGGAGLSCAS
jgi:putative SOS response-associated peptidase YedK